MAEAETTQKVAPKAGKLAVVLVRGREIGLRRQVLDTLNTLRLGRKHVCVLLPDNRSSLGQLQKVKDFVTFGPVSSEVVTALKKARSSIKSSEGKELNVFRLHPPRGGWGRKGAKVSVQNGGCLGRRDSMDDLLKRMM